MIHADTQSASVDLGCSLIQIGAPLLTDDRGNFVLTGQRSRIGGPRARSRHGTRARERTRVRREWRHDRSAHPADHRAGRTGWRIDLGDRRSKSAGEFAALPVVALPRAWRAAQIVAMLILLRSVHS